MRQPTEPPGWGLLFLFVILLLCLIFLRSTIPGWHYHVFYLLSYSLPPHPLEYKFHKGRGFVWYLLDDCLINICWMNICNTWTCVCVWCSCVDIPAAWIDVSENVCERHCGNNDIEFLWLLCVNDCFCECLSKNICICVFAHEMYVCLSVCVCARMLQMFGSG